MQSENRYVNLIRTTELAKCKGAPFVPYDKYELEMFTQPAALEHLPKNTEDSLEGWKLYATVPSNQFSSLVENVKVYLDDPSKNTFGLMVSPDYKAFQVFIKQ